MPYLEQEDRDILNPKICDLLAVMKKNFPSGRDKANLNYVICRLVNELFTQYSYSRRSEGIAAVADAEHELRRRWLDPYEDKAKQRNGDVFDPDPKPPVDSLLTPEEPEQNLRSNLTSAPPHAEVSRSNAKVLGKYRTP